MKRFLMLSALAAAGCSNPEQKPAEPLAEQPASVPEPAPPPVASGPAVRISFTGGSPLAAVIMIRKEFKNGWLEHKCIVLPRDAGKERTGEIGGIVKMRDADSGKMVDVDFTTGYVLVGIVKEEGLLPAGEHPRMKIQYLDEHGATCDLWMEDPAPKKSE